MDINLSNDFILDSWVKKQAAPVKSVRAALHCFIKIAGMGDVAEIDFDSLISAGKRSQKKSKAAPAKEKDAVRDKKESYAQPPSEDSQEDAGKIPEEKTHEEKAAAKPDSAQEAESSALDGESGASNEDSEKVPNEENGGSEDKAPGSGDKELNESVETLMGDFLNN